MVDRIATQSSRPGTVAGTGSPSWPGRRVAGSMLITALRVPEEDEG
jgi:hypothetical protein